VSRIFDAVAALRRRLGPGGQQVVNRLLYEAIYSVPAIARLGFFNGGHHPPPPGMLAVPALAEAGIEAALYDVALRVHPGPLDPPPARILDIGCGLGGGLLYAAALFPGAALTGVDQSWRAVAGARRRLAAAGVGAAIRRAGGARLPFPDASFDLIAGIGSATYVGYPEFLREASRLLAPGGVLTITAGTSYSRVEATRGRLAGLAAASGLELRRFEDITAPCFEALQLQATRNAALIRRLPSSLRGYAAEWAVLPGSRRHGLYLAGEKAEFGAVFAKPR
jgi:SAM-dependent methyltransferase